MQPREIGTRPRLPFFGETDRVGLLHGRLSSRAAAPTQDFACGFAAADAPALATIDSAAKAQVRQSSLATAGIAAGLRPDGASITSGTA
ncbi:MAG: hypothetical protein Q8O56_15875 [Solirubrobacteraceae bacterium]|nr:hypothetical protein [Solirubrobacteraceae bacterium]